MLRSLYAPGFFLGFIGAALWLFETGQPAWLLGPLLVTAIGVSLFVERLIPYQTGWNHDHSDTGRDVAHALVNEASNAFAVLSIPLLAVLAAAGEAWPAHWPLVAQLGFATIVADIGISLAHYASHRIASLWRLHAVHHSVRRLYGFNGLMKHPLHQAIEVIAGTTPLVMIGMPQNVAWLLAFAVSIQLLLQHSNADIRLGALRYLWSVAPVHRWHHVASDTEGDVNFGLFTPLVDVVLGTARFGSSRHVVAGTLGISGDPSYPQAYLPQLAAPFVRIARAEQPPSGGARTS